MDIYNERIRPLFVNSGMTDAELEKKIGLPRGRIYDWSSGRNKSYKNYVDKISEYFGIPADYLLARGIFENWDLVIANKDTVLEGIHKMLEASNVPLSVGVDPDNEKDLMRFIPLFVDRIYQEGTQLNIDFATKKLLKEQNALHHPAAITPVGSPIPVLGVVRAGSPILAVENVVGYEFADVNNPDEYFFLKVTGDSMLNAGIKEGSRVLIHRQDYAEDGQIIACIVNGDEATLKRFKRKGDVIVLMPDNPSYQPIIVSCKEFETGYACILGVAKKVLSDL